MTDYDSEYTLLKVLILFAALNMIEDQLGATYYYDEWDVDIYDEYDFLTNTKYF